jgi:protein-S-isoprenylcysteine O-methyltransferase Ste14
MLDRLELKVPPLAVTVLAAIFSVMGHKIGAGEQFIPVHMALAVGACVALGGAWTIVAGVVAFRRAKTTVDPLHPDRSAQLVTGGVYNWTRNPMYLGFVQMLVGLAIAIQSPQGLAVAAIAALYLHRFQIVPEERLLRQRFDGEFDSYCRRVRRWL